MKKWILNTCFIASSFTLIAQNNGGSFTGNMEATFQYLNPDSIIGATQPPSIGLLNSYANAFYTNGNFKAGIRLESYLPRIQGYPNRFDGTGLGMRYVGYANGIVDVTLGNFYEQFGAGTIFRVYEDRNLGYDNALDGARVILRPGKGLQVKAVYGNQRYSFAGGRVEVSKGITRGGDVELHVNELIPRLDSSGLDIVLGGSFVSKYQPDDDPDYILPENVGSYGGRLAMRYKKLSLSGEYVHKENDPSSDNGYSYNTGHSALFNVGYSQKGLGILLSAKSVDNMSFRSDRTRDLQDVLINFLPALNKTHTYNLVATLYPYATQSLGEIAYQGEILYTIPKGSKLGGKYGIPVNVNYSVAHQPIRHTTGFDANDSSRITYKGIPFDQSKVLLWRDFNVNITYKFGKKVSLTAAYFNIQLNNDIAKVSNFAKGIIHANIGVAEIGWKINKKHNLRTEIQALFTEQDNGNWATVVLEYTISPKWFFGILDQYNYGNSNPDLRLHYLIGSLGWIKDATRLTLSYGRQRAGLFCVGGVCRFVPASNGLTISFTQSF